MRNYKSNLKDMNKKILFLLLILLVVHSTYTQASSQSHNSQISTDIKPKIVRDPTKHSLQDLSQPSSGDVKKEEPENADAEKTDQPLEDFELGKYQYCGNDRDCIWVINGCCDCANGGKSTAINKIHFTAFNARFNCLNVTCTGNTHNTGCEEGLTSCINHKCRYVEPIDEIIP